MTAGMSLRAAGMPGPASGADDGSDSTERGLTGERREGGLPATAAFQPSTRDLLDLIGDGIVSTDENGHILLFNRAAEDMFGYSRDEVIGRPVENLMPERFRVTHRQEVGAYASSTSGRARLMGQRREVVGRRRSGMEFPLEATLTRQVIAGRMVFTVVVRDVTDRHVLEEERRLLAAELAHRMKNNLAVVTSIISLTARGKESVQEYQRALQGRLGAIARANESLVQGARSGTALLDLVAAELTPFSDPKSGNVALDGPHVVIPSALALTLALVIHELATNAVKYGALSVAEGRLDVVWALASGDDQLVLDWRETGGPEVSAPGKRGFGMELIERSIARSVGGDVRLDFPPEGLRCRISVPLSSAQESHADTSTL